MRKLLASICFMASMNAHAVCQLVEVTDIELVNPTISVFERKFCRSNEPYAKYVFASGDTVTPIGSERPLAVIGGEVLTSDGQGGFKLGANDITLEEARAEGFVDVPGTGRVYEYLTLHRVNAANDITFRYEYGPHHSRPNRKTLLTWDGNNTVNGRVQIYPHSF